MPPNYNVIGVDPELVDPENGDFRLAPGSPAEGYGCQTFPPGAYRRIETPSQPRLLGDSLHRSSLEVSGNIEVDTVWDADTVRVVGDVKVLDGVTLSVAEGSRVEFQGHHRLAVQGRILAIGSPDLRIHFTSADPRDFAVDSTLAGAWNGLRFAATKAAGGRSRLEYCVIEYSKAQRDTAMIGPLELDRFSQLDLVNTIIRNNVADWGGALYCIGASAPRLVGCLLTDNIAFKGGAAIHSTDAYPKLVACTIAGNVDLNPEGHAPAAAVMSMVSKPKTTGCILWDNPSNFLWPEQIYEGKEFYTRYSDIEGGIRGEGCIDLDPFFVLDGGSHPFELLEASPCIDAGPPDTTGLELPPLDLAGRPRLVNGRLDMGAYEFQGSTSTPDMPVPVPMLSAHPNPFNPSTELSFTLLFPSRVHLSVHDATGRRLRTLYPGTMLVSGEHRVTWDGRDDAGRRLGSGVYLVRLSRENQKALNRKVVLLK